MADIDFIKNDRALYQFHWKSLLIEGRSVAGVETFISLPQLKICFDVGYSNPSLWAHRQYFLSHCHMDHASGIPFLISMKALNQQEKPIFYMPSYMIQPMEEIMKHWQKMEGHKYEFLFLPSDSCVVDVGKYKVKSFSTTHRVPSNGYCLFEKKKKLRAEFKDFDRDRLISLKEEGVELDEVLEAPVLAVTCDTTLDFLDKEAWLLEVPLLMIETTYADSRKTIANAREWGHIHLDELIDNLHRFNNEKIVLKHFSRRHQYKEVIEILEKKLPKKYLGRVEVLPW